MFLIIQISNDKCTISRKIFKAHHYGNDVAQLLTPFQSLLFAAGLRPTPAQATAVSWVSNLLLDKL